MANLYFVLGLKEFSNSETVKTQYRKLAKLYHPDKNPDNIIAEERFKQIAGAFDILGNPEKKKLYDSQLRTPVYKVQKVDPEIIRERRRKEIEALRIHELETRYFTYQKSFWNLHRRMMLGATLLIAITLHFVLNYFINYEDESIFLTHAMYATIYITAIYLFIDAFYLYFAFQQLKKRYRYTALKLASIAFIVLFIGMPFFCVAAANLRRSILLNYKTKEAKILMYYYDDFEDIATIQFYANYVKYSCKISNPGILMEEKKDLRIDYYPNDPRLCKIRNIKGM